MGRSIYSCRPANAGEALTGKGTAYSRASDSVLDGRTLGPEVYCGALSILMSREEHVERENNVLAAGSHVIAVLAGIAGIILLVVACRLRGWFPDTLPGREWVGSLIVFALSLFCFFEAYRFYRFFARPEIRDRYYARHQLRRNTKS